MQSFVVKYANYRIDEIWNNSKLTQDEKNRAINKISNAVIDCQHDYISINTAMRVIANLDIN